MDEELKKKMFEPKTVLELIEILKKFPPDMKVTYDNGNGLEIHYIENDVPSVDFH